MRYKLIIYHARAKIQRARRPKRRQAGKGVKTGRPVLQISGGCVIVKKFRFYMIVTNREGNRYGYRGTA